jgi:hypothetical protein
MKKVAIIQSNYIPWKGYFDMIAAVDEFILFDDMQYTRRDWRNRNQIKTPHGLQWLTIPVRVRGNYFQKIRETEIDGTDWASLHWKSLSQNYRKSAHFQEISDWLEPLYLANTYSHLSQLNRIFLQKICDYLKIRTKISSSSDYVMCEGKSERLADICIQAGASEYISGPAARDYLQASAFERVNVKLTWFNYVGYPIYPQLWGAFTHNVSILDMLFNCGSEASSLMLHASPAIELDNNLRRVF